MKPHTRLAQLCASLLLLTALLLSGCATGSRFTSAGAPTPGKARIYVYRKASLVGAAVYDKVYANGSHVADLGPGGYGTLEVAPGEVVISVNPKIALVTGTTIPGTPSLSDKKHEKLRFQAEAGKTYYVKWHITSMTSNGMMLVDEATGAKEISGCGLAKAGGG